MKIKYLISTLVLALPLSSFAGNYLSLQGSAPTNSVLVAANVFSPNDGTMITTPVTINPTTGAISGGAFTPTSVSVSTAAPGANAFISVANTSNTASSGALLSATVAGTSAGDPMLQFIITGDQTWTEGVDNSVVGNPLVMAASTALGTTNALSLTTSGQGTFTGPVVAAGTTLTGTAQINASGAAVTTIGTGGTGAVNLGNATGNTTVTGSLSTTTTLTGGTGITATTGNIAASAGAVNAATTMTATLGAITATNGNVVLGTAGNKLNIATGANASVGTSVAMVAGTVTVNTTAVTASSIIELTVNTVGGTQGILSAPTASIVAGTSFVINSSNNMDTSTVNYVIIN